MKQLNITFEDKEFEIIEEAKNKINKNWHDTILEWARIVLKE